MINNKISQSNLFNIMQFTRNITEEDITPKKSPKKCLFGIPDPKETTALLEKQFNTDRKLFLDRYNFDILQQRSPVQNESNQINSFITENLHLNLSKCFEDDTKYNPESPDNIKSVSNIERHFEVKKQDQKLKQIPNKYSRQDENMKPTDMLCKSDVSDNTKKIHPVSRKLRNTRSKPYNKQVAITDLWKAKKSSKSNAKKEK